MTSTGSGVGRSDLLRRWRTGRDRRSRIDHRVAVLLVVIGVAVALTGIAMLLVGAPVRGAVVGMVGLVAAAIGYRGVT